MCEILTGLFEAALATIYLGTFWITSIVVGLIGTGVFASSYGTVNNNLSSFNITKFFL